MKLAICSKTVEESHQMPDVLNIRNINKFNCKPAFCQPIPPTNFYLLKQESEGFFSTENNKRHLFMPENSTFIEENDWIRPNSGRHFLSALIWFSKTETIYSKDWQALHFCMPFLLTAGGILFVPSKEPVAFLKKSWKCMHKRQRQIRMRDTACTAWKLTVFTLDALGGRLLRNHLRVCWAHQEAFTAPWMYCLSEGALLSLCKELQCQNWYWSFQTQENKKKVELCSFKTSRNVL